MAKYYVHTLTDKQGDHEVHRSGCDKMPLPEHRKDLGDCDTCFEAVKKAKEIYSNVNGCYFCSFACHTS